MDSCCSEEGGSFMYLISMLRERFTYKSLLCWTGTTQGSDIFNNKNIQAQSPQSISPQIFFIFTIC